jgi:hypothetical protein
MRFSTAVVAIALFGSVGMASADSSDPQALNRAPEGGSTLAMSCSSAKQLVAREGAVILHTGGGQYDRYVAGDGACPSGTYARPAWVPTADSRQCPLGNYCTATAPNDF